MTCDVYWREGILLVERGLDDPHRGGCVDCARAHASRQELIDALPLIGASHTGDPQWQARVWRRIDGEHARPPWRWQWQLPAMLVVACAVVLWISVGRTRGVDLPPRFEIIAGGVAMRSTSANVGDHLRVTVGDTAEVWIYQADRLKLRCRAQQLSDRCTPDAQGMIVELALAVPGEYRAFVIDGPVAPPRGVLDEDRAALVSARITPVEYRVSVR